MTVLEIVDESYSGKWERMRTACRGLVLENGLILLSYETSSGLWMIPGGGLEPGEDELSCCVREVSEETGVLIRPSPCAVELNEYFGTLKHVNRYFPGTVIGQVERNLTERERLAGMEPRWIPAEEALAVFAQYETSADMHRMRRALYKREYTALREYLRE